jgi:hypothetical protein
VDFEGSNIEFLSNTYEGKKHDKAICDEENYEFPEGSTLTGDLGFQGYEPMGAEVILPFKKPIGGELSANEKGANRVIASFRVRVEHVLSSVKRLRIVKDIFRNFCEAFRDQVMEIACALHNFRNHFRGCDS